MAEQNTNDQDARAGGYGGSRAPRDESAEETPAPDEVGGAGGRATPLTDPMDADEALGNRTGGYGGNPPATPDEPSPPTH